MSHTPQPVIDSIITLAEYLREQKYGCAIVAPNGGASFHQRSVFDEKAELFAEVTRLEERVAELEEESVRKDGVIRKAQARLAQMEGQS